MKLNGAFGDFIHVILGGTPKTSEPKYWDGDIPWVSIVDFNGTKHVYATAKTITREGLDKSNTKLLNEGDVIISARGTVGKTIVCGKPMAFNQSCYALRTKDEKSLNQDFLYYLTNIKVAELRAKSVGGVFDTIIRSTIEGIDVELPPPSIQRRIALTLSAYDDLIENNLRRIKLLEDAARCEYKILLENSTGYVPLHEMTLPIKRGISPKYVDADGVVVINQKCIRTLNVDFTLSRLTDKNKPIAKERMLQMYDVLVNSTGTGTLGRVSVNLNADFPCTVDSHVTIVRAVEESMSTFLAMSLLSQQHIIGMMGEGSTNQTELSPKRLGQEIKIPVVDIAMIADFHKSVSSKLDLIWTLSKQNTQLRQARDILLPKLMSGEIDVSDQVQEAKLVEMPVPVSAVAEDEAKYETKKPKPGAKYYMRTVLAAYIVDTLWQENTFGHVKLMKLMYLCEHLAGIETVSNYHRDAAGPYDNQMLRSIDKQLKTKEWFEMYKNAQGYSKYKPMAKRNDYKTEFDKYYSDKQQGIDRLLGIFGKELTEKAEMVATIYEAWRDLRSKQSSVSEDEVVNEVLNNWHESKKRIGDDRWRKCYGWMKQQNWIPN